MQLCAITAYFNPLNFEAPRKNYELFEARLLAAGVSLYVVECEIDGTDSRPLQCHANLIQTRGRDFLWHRERMINLALPLVPKNFDAVAWVDADILFVNPDWRAEAEERLREQTKGQSNVIVIQKGAAGSGRPSRPRAPLSFCEAPAFLLRSGRKPNGLRRMELLKTSCFYLVM